MQHHGSQEYASSVLALVVACHWPPIHTSLPLCIRLTLYRARLQDTADTVVRSVTGVYDERTRVHWPLAAAYT